MSADPEAQYSPNDLTVKSPQSRISRAFDFTPIWGGGPQRYAESAIIAETVSILFTMLVRCLEVPESPVER